MLDRRSRSDHRRVDAPPVLSLVLAVYDPPIDALRQQLDAVTLQSSPDWECIVVDDASTDGRVQSLLTDWARHDRRRRTVITRAENGGIAAATNDGLDRTRGEFVALIDHDDVLDVDAVRAVVEHFAEHPGHAVVYTDEQTIDEHGAVIAAYRKPDWSPRRHLGHHYLAHLVAARSSVIGELRVSAAFEPSQDYDFYLRVIEAAERAGMTVGHVPRTLYSWRAIAGSSARDAAEKPEMTNAVRRCVEAAVGRRGLELDVTTVEYQGTATTSVQLVRPAPDPGVEVVTIGRGTTPGDVNAAVDASTADVFCLLDEPRSGDELAPLVALAVDAGAAGPKIVDHSGSTLLSAGRTIEPRLADEFAGEPADSSGPWGALFVERDVAALAPLGFTVSRSTFDIHGPLADDVGLDVAIAEFCRRMQSAGTPAAWTPQVELAPAGHHREQLLGDDPERERDEIVAAQRAPAIVRHFDLVGVGHHGDQIGSAHLEAHRLIVGGAVDLVTSDVFDTLVTRPVATPSDLFVELAKRVSLPDHVTPAVFAQARCDAERRARRTRSDARRCELLDSGADDATIRTDPEVIATEVDLGEIYAAFPASFGDPDAIRRAELELEAEMLAPIPETIALFEEAKRSDIPVVLVSDIYLRADELAEVLRGAGVDMDLVDEVVTSVDHRLGKAHGLLEATIERRGVTASRVVHLGDNEVADVATARDIGTHAVHLDVPDGERAVPTVPDQLRTWSRAHGTDLGISASVRAALVGSRLRSTPEHQFAVATVGPALAGFSRWVADTTVDLGVEHVHCLLREGATIAELMGITAPDGPTPVEVHASRWVTMRAAVTDGSREQLLTSLSRRADLTATHVHDAFGCDLDLVRRVIGGDVVPAAEVDEACRALADDDEARAQIIEGAAELRARVMRYLDQRLQLTAGPLVVADVGWGGTIQEGLTRILRAEGREHDVVGLYFAFSHAGEERVMRGARMHSYLPNVFDDAAASRHSRTVAHHADTIERIMTPEIGTLIDIDADGRPITRADDHDQLPRSLVAAQRGTREVITVLADTSRGLGDMADRRWHDLDLRAAFAEILADVIVAPSHGAATALGSWPHDDVAGTDHRAIADPQLADAVAYANVLDVVQLDPHGRRWISGLAGRRNRTLAAQLDAQRHSVDGGALAPVGDLGEALVAAFEVGDTAATLRSAAPVRQLPGGWTLLRLVGDVASLRSLRFDAGEHTAIVDVDRFDVRLDTEDDQGVPIRSVAMTDADLRYVAGYAIDERMFVHRPGGHVLLQYEPEVAARVRRVEVTIGFRAIRLSDESPLSATPLATRAGDELRRITGALRRRL